MAKSYYIEVGVRKDCGCLVRFRTEIHNDPVSDKGAQLALDSALNHVANRGIKIHEPGCANRDAEDFENAAYFLERQGHTNAALALRMAYDPKRQEKARG